MPYNRTSGNKEIQAARISAKYYKEGSAEGGRMPYNRTSGNRNIRQPGSVQNIIRGGFYNGD